MKNNYEKTKKSYEELFNILKKYEDICDINIEEIKRNSLNHLFYLELTEFFGIKVNREDIVNLDWVSLCCYSTIARYGKKYRRTISSSDDGTQPIDEYLYTISFPTGAYIFDDSYPKSIFIDFFEELKKYGPKYIDTINHDLYFTLDNAAKISHDIDGIINEYKDKAKIYVKKQRLEYLKNELQELENNL